MINRIEQYEERAKGAPLMTMLGIISGEILTDLEQHGSSTVRRLMRELSWSAPLVTMAVGALIREGLIQASQHDLEIVLELRREWKIPLNANTQAVPEAWEVDDEPLDLMAHVAVGGPGYRNGGACFACAERRSCRCGQRGYSTVGKFRRCVGGWKPLCLVGDRGFIFSQNVRLVMRIKLLGQLTESKKVRIRRRPVAVVAPKKVRGQNIRQEGTLWKSKMQAMALRLKKGRTRRDRSGAPMKRG